VKVYVTPGVNPETEQEPMRELAAMLAEHVPAGLTDTVYEVIVAPPLVRGSCHDTMAVVLGSAKTWGLRGAEGVVVGIVTVVPPEGAGVKALL
jgi:hypothetical protein